MNFPLITTIIPTYRRPDLLKGAILSALNQTMPKIQVCVYDNASGDNTAHIVEELMKTDSRLKYYCHSHAVEAAQNFLFGCLSVNTPFFSILADDDLLAPDFYETALLTLAKFPKSAFFLGSTLDVKENGEVISANALMWEDGSLYEPPLGLYQAIRSYFNWTGALFRSSVLNHVQIDPSVKPLDLDFILRLAAQYPFAISKKPCALFIHHYKSYSSNSGFKLVWPSWVKMIKNIEAFPLLDPKKTKELMFAKLSSILFSIALGHVSKRQFQQANATLAVLLKEFPNHQGGKLLLLISKKIENNSCLFWIFRTILNFYRFRKTVFLKIKYKNFAKNLISKFR